MIFDKIHQEHRQISLILNLLDKQIDQMALGSQFNLHLIREGLDYLHHYSHLHHHKIEDALYQYYQQHVAHYIEFSQLEHEHERLYAEGEQLKAALNEAIDQPQTELDPLIEQLSRYVEATVEHLNYEEGTVLPEIKRSLNMTQQQQLQQQLQPLLLLAPTETKCNKTQYSLLMNALNRD